MTYLKDFKEFVDNTIHSLELSINKNKSRIDRDKRKAEIINGIYGLSGKIYNRDELSMLLDITAERVRQIIIEVIGELQNQLHSTDSVLFKKDYQSIKDAHKRFKDKRAYSRNQLLTFIESEIGNDIKEHNQYLDLLFDVLEFKQVKIHQHHLRENDLIICDSKIDSNEFIKVCYAVYLSVEQNTIPIDRNDLVIQVKRKLKGQVVLKELIFLACDVIEAVETLTTENHESIFQIRFHKLSSSSDMAYRILFEKGSKIKLVEILREINFRLHGTDKKRVDRTSLNSQMNMDKRFQAIGKSGYWTLKEWNEDNDTMYDLITDTLTLFNKPLTKKDIFEHILKSRPQIPTRSLDTVIYNSRYSQIEGRKFILSEWSEIYKDKIIKTVSRNATLKQNPITQQIKNQVVTLFKQNSSSELLLSSVVTTLHKKFRFPKASVYKIVSDDTDFETRNITSVKKIITYKMKDEISKSVSKSTSVFISYCWESEEYKEKVISFIDFLRQKGFEADMDVKLMQEESSVDFNRLMHKGILAYDKVIVLLSKKYKVKAESFDGGVGKEYKFIIEDIEKKPQKYILASFAEIDNILDLIVPIGLKSREIVDLYKDEAKSFETLFTKLTDTQKYIFSDVASNTPIVEQKKIQKFTLQ